ncbi:MAG TPA: hypothetical protein VIM44_00275 [Rariglobus sp.]
MLTPYCTVTTTIAAARAHLDSVDASASSRLVDEVARWVERLFQGRHPDYQKADLRYHDLQHTVLATQCFIDLAAGRIVHGAKPVFGHRDFSLGCVAILMHDTGYIKRRDDVIGTGAKYTNSHVERSCGLAASFLPVLGVTEAELATVLSAIRCTGISARIDQIAFRDDIARLTGCMVATADYLGQMADPAYPEKLPALFAEFEEANEFEHVPPEKRMFKSAKELMAKTGGFWTHFALPKLEKDYEGVYRLLAGPDGDNPYVAAVEANLARIAETAVRLE